jgi:hypothetical protein
MTDAGSVTLSVRCPACQEAVKLVLGDWTVEDALFWAGGELSEMPQMWTCPHCDVWNSNTCDRKIVCVAAMGQP